MVCFLFFFKQKTAYEMRISDWSSECALPIYAGRFPDRRLDPRRRAGARRRLLLFAKGRRGGDNRQADPRRAARPDADARRLVDQPQRRGASGAAPSSEESRVGKACVLTCRYRGSSDHTKKNQTQHYIYSQNNHKKNW